MSVRNLTHLEGRVERGWAGRPLERHQAARLLAIDLGWQAEAASNAEDVGHGLGAVTIVQHFNADRRTRARDAVRRTRANAAAPCAG